jgi:hypothetical protein
MKQGLLEKSVILIWFCIFTWHNLFAVLTPRSRPHDQGQLLILDKLGEVVSCQGDHSTWRWLPVGVGHLSHVLNDAFGSSLARVVLKLGTLLKDDQGGEALDHMLLGQFTLLGGIDLGQDYTLLLKDVGGLFVFYKRFFKLLCFDVHGCTGQAQDTLIVLLVQLKVV